MRREDGNEKQRKTSLHYACEKKTTVERRKMKIAEEENSSMTEEFSSYIRMHAHARERKERVERERGGDERCE